MTILFLASFPIKPITGGVQRVTAVLAEEFESMGHQVLYCSTEASGSEENLLESQQCYLGKNKASDLISLVKLKRVDVLINQAGVYKRVTDILRELRRNNPSVKILTVHHNCISCLNDRYRDIILGNKSISAKLLNVIGNNFVWSVLRFRNKVKYRGLFREAMSTSDYLVLLSDTYRRELVNLGLKRMDKVHAILNPASFEIKRSALDNKENRIVFIGRLIFTQKRVDRLMLVIEWLHRKHSNWYFDIVGDGPERIWMEQYKASKRLSNVVFHGFSDPSPFLERAKILLLPSDFEGFGMVIPEAQAYGVVPVVTPCFPSVYDIVGEQSGLILKDLDPESMVEAVNGLIDSPLELERLARGAFQNVEGFMPSRIAMEWIKLIDHVSNEE